MFTEWRKLCGGTGGPPLKSLDSDENFKPEHTPFCRELRFVVIYTLFWKSLGKKSAFLKIFGQKSAFWVKKTVCFGQEVHYSMVYIAYFTELNLQICDYAQKWRICRENCKYALDENFHGHFCPRREAAKFCHPECSYDAYEPKNTVGRWSNLFNGFEYILNLSWEM